MTATQSTRRRGATWWRAVCRAAAAWQAIHDEQVLMWELVWNHLPSPDQSQAARRP